MEYPEIWAMFFASLCSIQGHPGNKSPVPLVELASQADAMYEQFLLRKRGEVWLPG